MKNNIIAGMGRGNILAMTSISLPRTDEGNKAAYTVYKFKKAVEKALSALQESEKGLFAECGIDDPQGFNAEINELTKVAEPTSEQIEKMNGMKEKAIHYNALAAQLYEEEQTIECTPIGWDMWRILLDENKDKNGTDILSPFESVLEGVLWEE